MDKLQTDTESSQGVCGDRSQIGLEAGSAYISKKVLLSFIHSHHYYFTIMKTLTIVACLQLLLPASLAVPRPKRQLPCTHPLRLSAPELFTHCDNASGCTYGMWSSWARVSGSVTAVPKSMCSSGKSYTEQRTRLATGSGCDESALMETQDICKSASDCKVGHC